MIEVFFTFILFSVTIFLYSCVIRPKKMHDRYVKAFKEKGFKVY